MLEEVQGDSTARTEQSDAELLLKLRSGDTSAYEALWTKHVGAALRLAQHVLPSRAEDLVSDSFLRVYQQVATTDKGPTSAFRAYLFTVMRNTAMRWNKDAERVETVSDVENSHEQDGLSFVEEAAGASITLASFKSLPERWQRVLWLSEVEGVSRPKIAAELGIKPNAVSALLRRARSGFRLQWITHQIPESMRTDEAHIARVLPQYLTTNSDAITQVEVDAHLAECTDCRELYNDLRVASTRFQNTALPALGFAALGISLPAAAHAPIAVVASSAAVVASSGVGLTGGGLITGGTVASTAGVLTTSVGILTMGVLTFGLLANTGVPTPQSPPSDTAKAPTDISQEPPLESADRSNADDATLVDESDGTLSTDESQESTPTPTTSSPPTGRHVLDTTIDIVDLLTPPHYSIPVPPEAPTPRNTDEQQPPSDTGEGSSDAPQAEIPDSTETTQPPETATGQEPAVLTTGLTTPSEYTDYFAPVLQGSTEPGAQVVVTVRNKQYLAESNEQGEWTFDLRFLSVYSDEEYEYQVEAFTDSATSAKESGTFTLIPVQVEGLEGQTVLDVTEAQNTGIVIALTGPASGTVCLDTMQGHYAEIGLDSHGFALKRLRMHSRGFYMFNFRTCADGYQGATVERYADVEDPEIDFDFWGPDPSEMTFDITDP